MSEVLGLVSSMIKRLFRKSMLHNKPHTKNPIRPLINVDLLQDREIAPLNHSPLLRILEWRLLWRNFADVVTWFSVTVAADSFVVEY